MRLDRLTLLLAIADQIARLGMTRTIVVQGLLGLLMARACFAYDPRKLARVLHEAAASRP